MKKILTFIVMSMCLLLTSNAQNLIDFWNGYNASTATYATGEGSQCNKWGWSTNPATAVTNWNTANGSGNIRYMDNVSGYDAGRIMYIRWDGVVSTSGKYYLKLDTINTTKLTAGHAYTFTWSYAWNSNASAPTITTTVCTARDGSGAFAPLEVTGTDAAISGSSATFPLSTTAKSMRTGSLTFLASKDGDYYISFGANTGSLCAIRDLSLVDKGTDYAALAELQKQTDALSLGDVSAVTSNLTLPTTAGTQGVTVKWASSNNAIVDTFGVVTRPQTYNAYVTLTATLSMVLNGKTYSQTKSFKVVVSPINEMPTYMARWKFDSNDITTENGLVKVKDQYSGFQGTVKNDASIRTIGNPGSAQYNVLYLGNGSGYLDMGTEIGKAIYSLADYTMCGYFRIDDDYTGINNNGNFYWTFSNTDSAMTKPTGYIIGSLKAESQSVSSNRYDNGNQATGANVNAGLGKWHHFAYTQKGNTGTVYIDGVQVAQNTAMTNLPAYTLPKAGLTGTLYNWLGRSNYVADSYLRKTMLYDFQLLSTALTSDDIAVTGWNEGEEGVISTLGNLEAAYAQNPNYVNTDLNDELANLTFAKLTTEDSAQVTSDLTLPTAGLLHNNVAITWSTSNNKVITAAGQVTRPDYYPYTVTLTANLSLNGQKVSKTFHPTVLVKPGTQFANDLLVKYDFANVTNDTIVTDAAEKHFTGVVKNTAYAGIRTIGTAETGTYKVLALGDSIGYFDMGAEVGKLLYHLNDFTMSTYYRVDETNTTISKAGNFIWNFSNSTKTKTDQNGCLIGILNNQSVSITPYYYGSGAQSVSFATTALSGGWHNLTYTQSGTTGTVYIDGMPMATGTITNLLSTSLPKDNLLGTPYNWIGRSCYAENGDLYLRKTMVYDFRLYRKALNDEEIQSTVLSVGNTISALDAAYIANHTSAVNQVKSSQYQVIASVRSIKIIGLAGGEKVSVVDVTGRQFQVANPSDITVTPGMYIVKVNGFVTKVVVK